MPINIHGEPGGQGKGVQGGTRKGGSGLQLPDCVLHLVVEERWEHTTIRFINFIKSITYFAL